MDAEEEGGPFGIGVTLANRNATQNEEAAEIPQQDLGPERQLSSSKLNRKDEVLINRLRSGHTWITHEYLIHDIVQAGPEPCPFCNSAVKSVKHFITGCEDLIILRNEVFESDIGRNVFDMREVFTSASTLVKVLSFLRLVGLYELV